MRVHQLALILALVGTTPAQAPGAEALQQATARLHKALATTTALPSCAFSARWGPTEGDGKAGDDAQVPPNFGADAKGDAKGIWTADRFHLKLGERTVEDDDGGGDSDELLFAGRRMLAKDGHNGWTPRSGRFADGNKITFLPDPSLLLSTLRDMDLQVVHREAASIDDRPVEVVTATLTDDQQATLSWNGQLPEGGPLQVFFVGAGGKAARTPAPKPEATVDIAVYLDPGTGLLHRLHIRMLRSSDAAGGQFVFVAGGVGGARIRLGGAKAKDGDEDNENDAAATAEANTPPAGAAPVFQNGLPVRPTKKMQVLDYVIDLSQHGTARLPQFDAATEALLGR